jgi:hypothetical protein
MEDARHIAANMRQADRQECEALTGAPPEIILPQAIGKPGVITWEVDGVPVAMGGVDQSIPHVGVVWMATTNDIIKHRRKFLRVCRPMLRRLHQNFPILTNLVDARNTLHIRWLKWLGFVFTQKIERWGAASVPFIEFARLEPSCV